MNQEVQQLLAKLKQSFKESDRRQQAHAENLETQLIEAQRQHTQHAAQQAEELQRSKAESQELQTQLQALRQQQHRQTQQAKDKLDSAVAQAHNQAAALQEQQQLLQAAQQKISDLEAGRSAAERVHLVEVASLRKELVAEQQLAKRPGQHTGPAETSRARLPEQTTSAR